MLTVNFFNLIGNDVCSFVIKNYFCIRNLLKLDCLDFWLFLVLVSVFSLLGITALHTDDSNLQLLQFDISCL